MKDQDIRRHLEHWDPAADREPPAVLRQRVRARLDERRYAAREQRGVPRWTLATLAGLAAILVAVIALRLAQPRPETTLTESVTDPHTAEQPVQMVYTASNGVRIYWNVPATRPTRN